MHYYICLAASIRFWYLWHRLPAKTRTSLRIHAVSPDHSLLAIYRTIKYDKYIVSSHLSWDIHKIFLWIFLWTWLFYEHEFFMNIYFMNMNIFNCRVMLIEKWHDKTNKWLCFEQRLRSDWDSAQCDLSVRCAQNV